MVADHLEGVASVEVVGVDDGKRLVDGLLGHQDGVVGAPGFLAAFGHLEAFGQIVQLLEHILHLDAVAEMLGVDFRFELLLKAVADNKDHFAESGADGVVDRIVHDDFAVGAYAVHLFQSAVAAAHTGSQY